MMKNDLKHYEKLRSDKEFSKFKEYHKFNVIHSLAGGHPKLESCLQSNRIEVYDINVDLYLDSTPDFCRLYSVDINNISYNQT